MRSIKKKAVFFICFAFSAVYIYGPGVSYGEVDKTVVKMDSTLAGKVTVIQRDPFKITEGSLWEDINIPSSADYVKIERGRVEWILKKEEDIRPGEDKFFIRSVDTLFASGLEPGPVDALSGIYGICRGGIDMETSTDTDDGENAIRISSTDFSDVINIPDLDDDNNMTVCILPADTFVKNVIKRLKPGDSVEAEGMILMFPQDWKGFKEYIDGDISGLRVLYISSVKINR